MNRYRLAQIIDGVAGGLGGAGDTRPYVLRVADAVLARFAVVELPAPDDKGDWPANSGRVVHYDAIDDQVWFGLLALAPADARTVAAGLIAAANHAEQVTR